MRLERFVRWNQIVVALVLGTAVVAVGQGPSLAGRWDATVIVNDLEIPFPFEITEDNGRVMGSFFQR